MTKQPSRHSSRSLLVAGIVIAGLTSVVSLGAMVAIAIEKFGAGRVLDTYRTYWMVEGNWVAFLVFVAVAAVALLVGLLFRLKEWRELAELEARYREGGHG